MKTSRPILIAAGLAAFALLGVGLYLQHVQKMAPCPLCVLQRYAFLAVGIVCLLFALLPKGAVRPGAALGSLAALSGLGVAGYHIWVKANPTVSCGIDPLETSLNKIFTAELLPFLLKADGLCATPYPPIFGLSIPQWSAIWFAIFALTLGWAFLRRSR